MAKNIWNNKSFNNSKILTDQVKWLNSSGNAIFTLSPRVYRVEIMEGVTFYEMASYTDKVDSINNKLNNSWTKTSYDTNKNNFEYSHRFFEIDSTKVDIISFKYKCITFPDQQVMAIHWPESSAGQIVVNLPNTTNGVEVGNLITANAKSDIYRVRFYYKSDASRFIQSNTYIEIQNKFSKKIMSDVFEKINIIKDKYFTTF